MRKKSEGKKRWRMTKSRIKRANKMEDKKEEKIGQERTKNLEKKKRWRMTKLKKKRAHTMERTQKQEKE